VLCEDDELLLEKSKSEVEDEVELELEELIESP
jgi:hypothetical protein